MLRAADPLVSRFTLANDPASFVHRDTIYILAGMKSPTPMTSAC